MNLGGVDADNVAVFLMKLLDFEHILPPLDAVVVEFVPSSLGKLHDRPEETLTRRSPRPTWDQEIAAEGADIIGRW